MMSFQPELFSHRAGTADLPMLAKVSIAILAVLSLCALAAPVLAPFDQYEILWIEPYAPAWSINPHDGRLVILGTDELGRDRLSRLLFAMRNSFVVAALGATFALALALLIRLGGGTLQRQQPQRARWRHAFSVDYAYLLNLWSTFPPVLIALLYVGFSSSVLRLGTEGMPINLVVGIALAETARLIRAPSGGRGLAGTVQISIASALVIEASLGFVGLGLQPPFASLGDMVRSAAMSLVYDGILSLLPAVIVLLAAFALRNLGDALSDAR